MERDMVDASVAKRLVQVIIDNLPEPVPGRRPVHTIGMGVKGKFVASDVARTYCIAEHFNGQPVDVSVRFSNGLGGWSSMMDGPMFGEWRHASTFRTGGEAI
jgi:catalase